eukprot:4276438-Karenia_brevis.AAC.1
MGHHYAIVILKTVTGGWITSRRTQQLIKDCIFCNCPSGDCMQHLFECDTLWYAIANAFPPFSPFFTHPELLGLPAHSPSQIYGVVLAYHVYHSLRNS